MKSKPISLVGVPMDLGGGRRGVDMGPTALRIAGIGPQVEALGIDFEDRGNVPVEEPPKRVPRDPKARFIDEIATCCRLLRSEVEAILDAERLPLVVGGDHSIACGTVAGLSSHYARRGERIGLIWFDAHGDMNTPETTESGNVHGMPLAACLGKGVDALARLGERVPMVDVERTVIVGVRSLDDRERELIRDSGVTVFAMRDVDELGIHAVTQRAIDIACDGTAGFHLSFDLDGTDPSVAPGVGTPVRGGTTWRESHLFMETVAESGRMLGLEVTELNPILDDRNFTAEQAVGLILSALGKVVL